MGLSAFNSKRAISSKIAISSYLNLLELKLMRAVRQNQNIKVAGCENKCGAKRHENVS